jgi:dihydrofolate reductase
MRVSDLLVTRPRDRLPTSRKGACDDQGDLRHGDVGGRVCTRTQPEPDEPFGEGVHGRLHRWMFEEADAHADEIAAITAARAYVMGRNMFGPGRGAWDLDWKGWWGDEPPYHAPVFVLAHHERASLQMEGGTTFQFLTDGTEAALERAREAAGEGDVAIAGGAATVNHYLAAGLIDELRLNIVPVLLGAGERALERRAQR